MKTMKQIISLAMFLYIPILANAQATYNDNVGGSMSDYLGWSATTAFDLDIKHKNAMDIIFSTSDTERMRLTSAGVFRIGGVPATGAGSVTIRSLASSTALRVQASGTNGTNYAGYFQATGSSNCYGLFGDATLTSSGNNYGVYAQACSGANNFALFGDVCGDTSPNTWAGYFDGRTYQTVGAWQASDEKFENEHHRPRRSDRNANGHGTEGIQL